MAARQPRSPVLIDRHVGRWLRALRKAAGLSREEFAGRAGLTVQQIHKYETGQNRISAGRLAELADILGVSPADFYLGAEVLGSVLAGKPASDPATERDVCDLLIAYLQIPSEEQRVRILAIVKAAGAPQVKDRSESAFAVREIARRPTTAPMRSDRSMNLTAVMASVSGREALAQALPRAASTSWIKPAAHLSGEIGSPARI